MIEVTKGKNDNYFVTVGTRAPLVYLDNWAVIKIARNVDWQRRFVSALKQKEGTLLFSILNIIELGRKTKELADIEIFLHQIGTDWCLVDINPPAVIEREKESNTAMPPNFDEQALRSYYPYIHGAPLTLGKIISLIQGQKNRYEVIYDMFEPLVKQVTQMREDIERGDPRINPDAYKTSRFNPEQPTLYVYYSLMRKTLYGNFTITKNHLCDLQHATAALAYADFILLDKHWTQLAKDSLKELPNIKQRVFKDSPKEMEKFLKTLENCKIEEKT